MKTARMLFGVLLSGASVAAQLRPRLLESLVQNSPFWPGQGGALPADGGPVQFEFRGVVAEGGGYSFSVYDSSRREASWVKLDETGRPFVARHYDPVKDTLTIEHNGQTLTLNLKRAIVQSLVQAPPAPAAPSPLPAPPPTNAINAQEAQRLQSVADEIRRRRALRQMPPAENPAGKP